MKRNQHSSNDIHQQLVEQTRNAESKIKPDCDYRLGYHLMPPTGWMNDPNGLCQFHGIYHVFFQYSPLDAEGGMKAWGHYTSKDMIHWEYEGTPFFPDQSFDLDGVYSGSALIDENQMYLFYTGNVKQEGEHDYIVSGREANTVLITSKDGFTFSEKQLLMTNEDYPATYTCHIRDPKVWKEGEWYYMVQGGRKREPDERGTILFFRSKDLYHWEYINEMTTERPFGYMWECPDYYSLSDEEKTIRVLSVSPQGVKSEPYRMQNIYQSGHFIIPDDFSNDDTNSIVAESFEEWDYGFDFYAPQSFQDERGRRILYGWIGIPDAEYDNLPTVERGWQHALTMPRNITYRQGKIYQAPVEEIQSLRKNEYEFSSQSEIILRAPDELKEWKKTQDDDKIVLEDAMVEIEISDIPTGEFQLLLEQHFSGIRLFYEKGIFTLSFYGAMKEEIGRGREKRQLKINQLEKIHLYIDRSVIEVYINDGEYVLTSRYYMKGKRTVQIMTQNCKGRLWELNAMSK